MVTASRSVDPIVVRLELRGGNLEAWNARDPEILVEGPRGTGKTRSILELINQLCHHFDGLQWLIARKYAVTLASTCLKTFNEQVLKSGDGVAFFGGSPDEPASYRYRNGSRIVVGGLDNPKARDKMLSAEYDGAFVNEITELVEDDLTAIKATLRHARPDGSPIIEHRRVIGDCNPTNRSNWVNQRCERGEMRRIRTTLKDNPRFANADGSWTEEGERYLRENLPRQGSARYDSWVLGLWSGTENACYPMFDRSIHVRPLEPGLQFKVTIIGEDYGSQHLCAVAALSIDQYNRRWVREVWSGADERPDPSKPSSMDLIVAQFKDRYKAKRGRVDPNQAKLARDHGFNVAKGGSGGRSGPPRLTRISDMDELFYLYEGGRVPSSKDVKNLTVARGPFAEPDSPCIFLVEGMPGIEDLANEIEGYHFVYSDSVKGRTKDVFRENDDRIAAVEYANEEWVERPYAVAEERLPGIPLQMTSHRTGV